MFHDILEGKSMSYKAINLRIKKKKRYYRKKGDTERNSLTSSDICCARRIATFLSMHSEVGLGMFCRAFCSTTAWSCVAWFIWKKVSYTYFYMEKIKQEDMKI